MTSSQPVVTPPPAPRAPVSEPTRNGNGAWRFDLLSIPLVRRAVKHRAFQFTLIVPNLFFFTLVILTGLFGSPVGNRNFSIIFVWIVWWAALIALLIPFGSRIWCTMCPIPAVGEWVQRQATISRSKRRPFTLGLTWPRSLRNIWPQNIAFLGVATFSTIILTRPMITGIVLLSFVVVAFILYLLYQRRVFCRYVCPVGGFIGLYSMTAPVELRAVDPDVCVRHCGPKGKECVRGSALNYGCPWMEYPGTLERNAYCGMCMECVKNCPQDNIALNLRPFGTDLLVPKRHMDEAFKAFIMLSAAVLYSAVLLGPWGVTKEWANLGSGSIEKFIGYAVVFLSATMVIVPGVFLGFVWAGKLLARAKGVPLRRLFVSFAYAAVPLGLMGWVAFTFSFVLANVSYAIPLVSDPFGWGWNLFGTANYGWRPYMPQILPYLQVPALMLGLSLSIVLANRISVENIHNQAQARLAALPVSIFLTGVTLVFLWLYLG